MISLGKKTLARVHTRLMGTVFKIQSFGLEHIPSQQQLLIASNHASHLDYGVLKAALSKKIIAFGALAAADYFFDQRWKRKILLPLTNLVPVMRQGSFSLALKEAETALTNGRSLLIFPRVHVARPTLYYRFVLEWATCSVVQNCQSFLYLSKAPRRFCPKGKQSPLSEMFRFMREHPLQTITVTKLLMDYAHRKRSSGSLKKLG